MNGRKFYPSSVTSTLIALWVCAILSLPAIAAPSKLATGPSFSCAGQLTQSEMAICSDPTLSAYDRAMAWAYERGWHSIVATRDGQSEWLVQRNTCAGSKSCLFAIYHAWIGQLEFEKAPAPNFGRVGWFDNGEADLMLGNLQSPTGSVRRLGDTGRLFVQAIGGNWFLFRVDANHSYDPHDGLGPNVSTSDVTGLVLTSNGIGVWNSNLESADDCTVQLNRLSHSSWRVIERGICGGLGATLTGTYRRLKR